MSDIGCGLFKAVIYQVNGKVMQIITIFCISLAESGCMIRWTEIFHCAKFGIYAGGNLCFFVCLFHCANNANIPWVSYFVTIIGLTRDTTSLFHGPWHDHVSEYIGIGICAESFGLGSSLSNYRFYVSLTNISKRKSDANKHNFERTLNLTWKVNVNQSQNHRDLKQNLLNCLLQIWWF